MIKRIINYVKWLRKYKRSNIKTKDIGENVSFGIDVSISRDSQIWGLCW